MTTPPDETAAGSSPRLDEARGHAEAGRLDRAAEQFRAVLAAGDTAERAQAALGLAVVLESAGDAAGARAADQAAVETQDPEYGARAAYHLALSWERSGDRGEPLGTGSDDALPPLAGLRRVALLVGDLRQSQQGGRQVGRVAEVDDHPPRLPGLVPVAGPLPGQCQVVGGARAVLGDRGLDRGLVGCTSAVVVAGVFLVF